MEYRQRSHAAIGAFLFRARRIAATAIARMVDWLDTNAGPILVIVSWLAALAFSFLLATASSGQNMPTDLGQEPAPIHSIAFNADDLFGPSH